MPDLRGGKEVLDGGPHALGLGGLPLGYIGSSLRSCSSLITFTLAGGRLTPPFRPNFCCQNLHEVQNLFQPSTAMEAENAIRPNPSSTQQQHAHTPGPSDELCCREVAEGLVTQNILKRQQLYGELCDAVTRS